MRKKAIALICFSFIFAGNAIAQNYSVSKTTDESRSIPVYIQEFSGGLASHANDKAIKENSASDVLNARFNKKNGSVQKRNVMNLYGNIGAQKVTGLHRYYKSNGDRYLIASGGTDLYIGDDDDGTFTTAYSGLNDGSRFTFETYKDIAICTNGVDRPLKFDGNTNIGTDVGDRSEDFLMADLGGAFADVGESGSLDASSWYQYKILFKDEDGLYYYTDARSNPLQTGSSNKSISLSEIPIGRTGVTERQIYRTEGNASSSSVLADSTYKLVATLSDNSTTTYDDTTSDASLGVALSTDGHIDVTPPLGKYLEIHSERLFIAGNSEYKSDIYWSDSFNPDFFLPTSFEQIRPDDGDEVTFIKTVWGILAVGKRNSIQKFYATGNESTWYSSGVYTTIGCSAPYTVENTAIGLIFLGRQGLYRFDGQAAYLISDNVTDKIRDISQADIEECFGVYWNNEYHLAYTSQDSGESNNNKVLVYDLIRNNYSIDSKTVNCMETLESGLDYGLLYFGSSLADGKITSDGATVTTLVKKYKSELDKGTYTETRSFGSETDPYIELAWDVTGSGCNLTNGYPLVVNMDDSDPDTWLGERPSSDGNWLSPVFNVKASSFEKLYWNEALGDYGDVTARIRVADTEVGISSAPWSENYTDPTGSDISDLTGSDYLQISFNLSTEDISFTPQLIKNNQYVFRVTYNKTGVSSEDVSMLWTSGWRYLGLPSYRIQIKKIKVFYEGDDEGSFTFSYFNDAGDSDGSFEIDLSQSDSTTENEGGDFYRIENGIKSYTHYPGNAFGDLWQLQISDEDSSQYRVDRVEILIWHEEYPDL